MVSSPEKTPAVARRSRWRRWLGRAMRILGGVAATLVVLFVLLGLVLASSGGREFLLRRGLGLAQDHFPGTILLEEGRWPHPGEIQLTNLVWLRTEQPSPTGPDGQVNPDGQMDLDGQRNPGQPADTLAVVDDLLLDVDVAALWHHRLHVRRLDLSMSRVDGPAVAEFTAGQFPSSEADTITDSEQAPLPFLAEGSWPGLPWVQADSVRLRLAGIQLPVPAGSPGARLTHLDLRAGAALGREPVPAGQPAAQVWLRLESLAAVVEQLPHQGFALDDLEGRLWYEGKGRAGARLATDFRIPGPAELAALGGLTVPDSVWTLVGGSSPCTGNLRFDAGFSPDFLALDRAAAQLDLQPASWLQQGHLQAAVQAGRVTVDSLNLALPMASLQGSGWIDSTRVEWTGGFALQDSILLGQLAGPDFQGALVRARGRVNVAGPWRDPRGEITLESSLAGPAYQVPEFSLRARRDQEQTLVNVHLAGPAVLARTPVDSFRLAVTGPGFWPDRPPLLVTMAGGFQGNALNLQGEVQVDSLVQARVDSLRLQVAGLAIHNSGPLVLAADPARSRYSVQGLALVGEPGSVEMEGQWQPRQLRLSGRWDLLLTSEFLQGLVPNELWTRDGGLDVSARGDIDLDTVAASGPARWDMEVAAQPRGEGTRISLASHLAGVEAGDDSPGEVVKVAVDLATDQVVLLRAQAQLATRPDTLTGLSLPDPAAGIQVALPRQELSLRPLSRFMPAEFGVSGHPQLEGRLAVAPDPAGAPAGQMDFALDTGPLELALPNNSRATVEAACRVQGELDDPLVSGRITVVQGFIRIPELPPSLLPVKGESLLLDSGADTLLARAAGVSREDLWRQTETAGPPPYLPELDLKLVLPGGLMVRGFGLDAELAGELAISRGQDEEGTPMPVVRGNLAVAQGSFRLMNHQFQFTDSEILFQGAAPANPELLVTLETEVSGFVVRIEARGQALAPDVRLTAEPELEQADIMSLLLFGQTSSDLDTAQRGRMDSEPSAQDQLRRNLAGLAMMMGSSGLQGSLGNSLGLDMVELAAGENGDNMLSVGKFLTPRVLVKYNQSLEKGGSYFMTLDYTLSRFLKLVSTYGQGEEESGLELEWTRRY